MSDKEQKVVSIGAKAKKHAQEQEKTQKNTKQQNNYP